MKKLSLVVFSICVLNTLGLQAQMDSASSGLLSGTVADSSTSQPLPARIVVADATGNVLNSFYEKLPGFFTQTDGTFQLRVAPGTYTIKVYRGIDYLSSSHTVTIEAGASKQISVRLARWYLLKENGWVNGDGHDHLYTDVKRDAMMLDTVRRIFLAQGIDFMCAAQGWAGYNDTNWRRGYARFTDDNFFLFYGSEMPKYRTGHTWWLGQVSTEGLFDNTMDTTYENHYYQSESGTSWTFDSLKFPQIPDVEVVQRIKKYDSGIAVMAHPTSWWWQKRGNVEKYVTNVAAYLPLALLAGGIWDAQTIMGYDRDHYYYQNLWFHVLNAGYRMTPVSELDGGYNRGDKFFYGSMRTYYKIEGKLTMEKIRNAVRRGHTFVTSGPMAFTSVDGKYTAGDMIPPGGKLHTLKIEARASGDREDFISYVVVFRNGRIYKLWDTRKHRPRIFSDTLRLKENSRSWYVVKVYGRRAWGDPASLDVLKYCSKETIMPHDSIGTESDVAITSPFYFQNVSSSRPAWHISQIELELKDSAGKPVDYPVKVDLLLNGEVTKTFSVKSGKTSFNMPVHAVLRLTAPDKQPVYRCLYLDYKPYRDIVEHLASGKWLNDDPGKKFNPGEVSWSAFQFDKVKSVLSNVRWNIDLAPNERDPLWESFEKAFRD